MRYQPLLAQRKNSIYLDGFWQDQRYFADCTQHLRSQLQLRHPPPETWHHWFKRISETPAIGVHIRRGDYVTNDYVAKLIGPCDNDYYRRSVAYHQTNTPGLRVFLFTDDPPSVTQHFHHEIQHHHWQLVSGTGTWNEAAEMLLLSSCTHFVLSNSTFGWWAAWLSGAPGKNIIVPEPWYNDPSMRHIHPAPDSWLRFKKHTP